MYHTTHFRPHIIVNDWCTSSIIPHKYLSTYSFYKSVNTCHKLIAILCLGVGTRGAQGAQGAAASPKNLQHFFSDY